MKKTIRFAFCGVDFSISLFFLLVLGVSYTVGTVSSLFISVDLSDKLFSPLLILSAEAGVLSLFLHSFLYFFLFPILALVFATSYFGFLLFPPVIVMKGLFAALAIQSLLKQGSFAAALLLFGVLLVIEVSVLLLYFSQSMAASFGFFRSRKTVVDTTTFSSCLRQFMAVALFMGVLALGCGFVQYLM